GTPFFGTDPRRNDRTFKVPSSYFYPDPRSGSPVEPSQALVALRAVRIARPMRVSACQPHTYRRSTELFANRVRKRTEFASKFSLGRANTQVCPYLCKFTQFSAYRLARKGASGSR